jgi:hypothetical protein
MEEPVRLEPVHARVRRAPPPAPGDVPEPPTAAADEATEHEHRALTAGDAVPVVIVGLVGFFSGEVLVSVMAGLAALGALALRRAAIRERFGFGDGFAPFHSDLGWPRGVQEDDDFHWSWAGRQDEAVPAARRSSAR